MVAEKDMERFKIYPTCSTCKKSFKSELQFALHKLICLPVKHFCLKCDLKFETKKAALAHKIDHYETVMYEIEFSLSAPKPTLSSRCCGICKRSFFSRRSFRYHRIFNRCHKYI